MRAGNRDVQTRAAGIVEPLLIQSWLDASSFSGELALTQSLGVYEDIPFACVISRTG